jgi:hypothetical protein
MATLPAHYPASFVANTDTNSPEQMRRLLRIAIAVFVGVGTISALSVIAYLCTHSERRSPQRLPNVHKDGGDIYFGVYKPSPPDGWAAIPEPARSRIKSHLTEWLGAEFFAQLSLVGGQIVDVTALHQQDPSSKNYQWEVPAYVLHLRLSLPERGIEYYDANIWCRSDGSVIQEIDLPGIAKHPETAEFISTAVAYNIAREQGIDVKAARVDLAYRERLGVCVYLFTEKTGQDSPNLHYKNIEINAHNGTIVADYKSEALE